jgi:RHS repeat-associated protein
MTTLRVTDFCHDFRGRTVAIDGELDLFQCNTFDNLDRVIRSERYDTRGPCACECPSSSSSSSSSSSAAPGPLIAKSETLFDARDRVYRTVRYGVDPATGTIGHSLTDNAWYDESGHVLAVRPAGSDLFTKTAFDSLGRAILQYTGFNPAADAEHPLGDGTPDSVEHDVLLEQSEAEFDDASSVIEVRQRQRYHNADPGDLGPLADPDADPQARVIYAAVYADALGRLMAVASYGTHGGTALVRPDTIPSRSDAVLVSSARYDAAGHVLDSTDPAGLVVRFEHDDVGRRITVIENYVASSSSSSGGAGTCAASDDQNRTTRFTFTPDGLQATLTAVNSRTDDQTTTYAYGTTLDDSEIAASTLLRSITYPRDENDVVEFTYNRQGERTTATDQRGVEHTYLYDLLGRLTDDCVTVCPAGVDDAVLRLGVTYDVRGLPETLTSYDGPDPASEPPAAVVNQVQFAYNDFGQRITTWQSHGGAVNVLTTPKIAQSYADGAENTVRPLTFTYPDGREIRFDYGDVGETNDRCSRITSIVDDDDTHLADYEYLGLGAVVKQHSPGPDLLMTLVSLTGSDDPDTGDIYTGVDRFGRVKDLRWRNVGGNTDLSRVQYGYNRDSNRLWRANPTAPDANYDWLYGYEGLQRLEDAARGTLTGGNTAIADLQFAQCWTLDPTGNWRGFRQDDDGAGSWDLIQSRTASQANEITAITNTAGNAWAQPAYDAAGNMTTIPWLVPGNEGWYGLTLPQWASLTVDQWSELPVGRDAEALDATYDAWNRLVRLEAEEELVAAYAYDAGGYRLTRDDGASVRHFYYTNAWQVIEERLDSSSLAERQFVWGLRYIDDLVLRDRMSPASSSSSSSSGPPSLDERLYALQDGNWNVTAVVDDGGGVQERYEYDPYGVVTFFDPSFLPRASSAFDWETAYCGYRFDPTTGLYAVRFRDLAPLLGWIQRDPVGYVDSPSLYSYLGASPTMMIDPSGLGRRTDMMNEINASMGIPRPTYTEADRRFDQGMAVMNAVPTFVENIPASAVQGTINIANAAGHAATDLANMTTAPIDVPLSMLGIPTPRPIPRFDVLPWEVLPEDPFLRELGGQLGFAGASVLIPSALSQLLARLQGCRWNVVLPQLPGGYHYRNVAGRLVVVRNPGRSADLPQLHLQGNQLVAGPLPRSPQAGYWEWSNVRRRLAESGWALRGQDVHHWLIPQSGWGRIIPDVIRNRTWNLMRMSSRAEHFHVHGWSYNGEAGYGLLARLWFGTPTPAKFVVGGGISGIGALEYFYGD